MRLSARRLDRVHRRGMELSWGLEIIPRPIPGFRKHSPSQLPRLRGPSPCDFVPPPKHDILCHSFHPITIKSDKQENFPFHASTFVPTTSRRLLKFNWPGLRSSRWSEVFTKALEALHPLFNASLNPSQSDTLRVSTRHWISCVSIGTWDLRPSGARQCISRL